MKLERTCVTCGSKFLAYPNQVKRGFARFCTKSCQVKNQHANKVPIGTRGTKRDKHHNWKGGRFLDSDGYVRVLAPDHFHTFKNGYVHEHVMIMERIIGRRIKRSEVVHHKDEDKTNNNPSNLELMTRSQHCAHHEVRVKSLPSRRLDCG